jgi:hypothetical protein
VNMQIDRLKLERFIAHLIESYNGHHTIPYLNYKLHELGLGRMRFTFKPIPEKKARKTRRKK